MPQGRAAPGSERGINRLTLHDAIFSPRPL
jgi:hypothetical protein